MGMILHLLPWHIDDALFGLMAGGLLGIKMTWWAISGLFKRRNK